MFDVNVILSDLPAFIIVGAIVISAITAKHVREKMDSDIDMEEENENQEKVKIKVKKYNPDGTEMKKDDTNHHKPTKIKEPLVSNDFTVNNQSVESKIDIENTNFDFDDNNLLGGISDASQSLFDEVFKQNND